MGGVRRVLTPLENRASLSNVVTQEGVLSPQGFSFLRPFVEGLSEPEHFTQARRNGEMLLPKGAQMVAASSAPVLPGPSPPFAGRSDTCSAFDRIPLRESATLCRRRKGSQRVCALSLATSRS